MHHPRERRDAIRIMKTNHLIAESTQPSQRQKLTQTHHLRPSPKDVTSLEAYSSDTLKNAGWPQRPVLPQGCSNCLFSDSGRPSRFRSRVGYGVLPQLIRAHCPITCCPHNAKTGPGADTEAHAHASARAHRHALRISRALTHTHRPAQTHTYAHTHTH